MIEFCKQIYFKLERGETLTPDEINRAIEAYTELARDLRETPNQQSADEADAILSKLKGMKRETRHSHPR